MNLGILGDVVVRDSNNAPTIPTVSFVATRMSLSKHPRLRYHVGWAFLQISERGCLVKDARSQRRQLVVLQPPALSQRCVRKQKKHTSRCRPQVALRDAQSRQALWSSASSPSSSPLLMSPSSSELWGCTYEPLHPKQLFKE